MITPRMMHSSSCRAAIFASCVFLIGTYLSGCTTVNDTLDRVEDASEEVATVLDTTKSGYADDEQAENAVTSSGSTRPDNVIQPERITPREGPQIFLKHYNEVRSIVVNVAKEINEVKSEFEKSEYKTERENKSEKRERITNIVSSAWSSEAVSKYILTDVDLKRRGDYDPDNETIKLFQIDLGSIFKCDNFREYKFQAGINSYDAIECLDSSGNVIGEEYSFEETKDYRNRDKVAILQDFMFDEAYEINIDSNFEDAFNVEPEGHYGNGVSFRAGFYGGGPETLNISLDIPKEKASEIDINNSRRVENVDAEVYIKVRYELTKGNIDLVRGILYLEVVGVDLTF